MKRNRTSGREKFYVTDCMRIDQILAQTTDEAQKMLQIQITFALKKITAQTSADLFK